MGCHTWFYNNFNNMPLEHYENIKKKIINEIRSYWIMNVSKEEFIKEIQEDIKVDSGNIIYKKMLTDGYYENVIKKYNNHLEFLDKTSGFTSLKESDFTFLKEVLKDHYHTIEINDNIFYNLSDFGLHDKFRVYGYPKDIFYNAQKLIEFLKNYDQNMIGSKEPYGININIENIIHEFFNMYPNGIIYFG